MASLNEQPATTTKDSVKGVSLTATVGPGLYNTSYSCRLERGTALVTVEDASTDLRAKVQRFNKFTKNWVDITNNKGSLFIMSRNGTYTINNASKPTDYRVVVTVGSGTFSVEQ